MTDYAAEAKRWLAWTRRQVDSPTWTPAQHFWSIRVGHALRMLAERETKEAAIGLQEAMANFEDARAASRAKVG